MDRIMLKQFPRDWMWSEACEMLARAERMQREFFRLVEGRAQAPAWEPPVDILETEREVLVLAALPGVSSDKVEAVIEDGDLVIGGTRILPAQLRNATIHRLELPQGRFQRRVALPPGRYASVRRANVDGCLVIALEKVGGAGG
jgi:HSP20 family protein